ncbi:MAG: hypothetical protein ACOH1M_10165 [Rhodoglobus sp.]
MIDFFIVSPVAAERFIPGCAEDGDLVLTIVFTPGRKVNAYLQCCNEKDANLKRMNRFLGVNSGISSNKVTKRYVSAVA